jgi:hypothetical protein
MTITSAEVLCCLGGFFIGGWVGVLAMALARVSARADALHYGGQDDDRPSSKAENDNSELFRLKAMDATLERVTAHLEKRANARR